ncbi:EAL domain-containing protein [Thiocapsa marina]|uniref:Response regulator receiver modulated diguanylate phosphodiesterase n=1 Tax=Thiocapsa marina 5811 TaxID=768671 RepID=F9UG79_9GAMM|nr:EAL domain-containing protein [Thiocapsa marina]EGV16805.1 response regulator receiver modulated diguanylate phosphodiesterase [Thiocapsa marina 5811]
MRLMCLDDDPRIEAVLGRFLKRFGHAVDFHVSIASFKAALESDLPELVLLDLGLGRENGIDVIHWLAETHPGIPVVLLSGHGDDLLDTARRIARSTGIEVLGAVSKSRMVKDLPAILERGVKAAAQRPHQDPQAGAGITRQDLEWQIRSGGIVAYFQPIVSPADGRLRGAEVLARLRLPSGQILGAGEFIPLAESSGLIYEVTETLFERLIESRETLAASGLTFIAVNLSPLILQQERALVLVRRLVDGLGGICAVKIEMTESAASAYPDILRSVAAQIHLMGVSLAIDDFGIGYSSMRAVAELPFDTLKIDLSFVSEMFDSPKALKLLRAMISFGQTLELQVVAEGVETEAQRRLLIEAGVDFAQGYLFGKPMTAELLASNFSVPKTDANSEPGSKPDRDPEPEAEPSRAPDEPTGRIIGGEIGRTIMVVDDDQRMLHAIARMVTAWGYRCETFTDARTALQVCEETAPAVLIVDIYMPELDGFEVIKRMRQIAPSTRIIAVSGDVVRGHHTNVLDMCRVLGADAILQKPIAPERLEATLERLIGGPDQSASGGAPVASGRSPGPRRVEDPQSDDRAEVS